MATLEELRAEIDTLDDELVGLLTKRANLVLEVKKTKARDNIDIYSSARERQILTRVLKLAESGHFPKHSLERIFVNIISATRSLIGALKVSCAGNKGPLPREAVLQQFGEDVECSEKSSVEEVFSSVERGDSNFGVVLAQTSSSGLVTKTFNLLLNSPLCVIAETEVEDTSKEQAEVHRFLVLGHKLPPATENDKTTLLCAVKERAGALREILRPFEERGISLLSIESRPMKTASAEHVFIIDIAGHQTSPKVTEAISALEDLGTHLKVVGSYPLVCHI